MAAKGKRESHVFWCKYELTDAQYEKARALGWARGRMTRVRDFLHLLTVEALEAAQVPKKEGEE